MDYLQKKYDKVIYSAIDFISKGSYIQIQSDCNRIAIGLKSDSFPTHTRDDKDIKIKIKDHHIDAVDDDNSTEKAPLEPPSEDMPEEDNSSDVADMEASEKEGACILDIPINSAWSEILMMKSGFSNLLLRNWQFALEVFRQHVIVKCKLDEMQVDGRKHRITLEDISGTADFGNKTDQGFWLNNRNLFGNEIKE